MMSPMRRTVPVLLLVALVVAACAGGDGDGGGGGGGGAGSGEAPCPVEALDGVTQPVPVTFWHGMTAENEKTLQALADRYNASQSRVRVSLAFQGTYDETADKYLAAMRGGNLPDLVMLEETRIQLMIDSGTMLPVQACVEASDYDLSDHLPTVLDAFRVDGDLWPMPFNVSTLVLFHDGGDLRRAGVTPPRSLEDITTVSAAVRASGAARTGIALDVSPSVVEQWFALAGEPIVDQENGRAGRATEARLDTATGRQIFTLLHDLVADGLAVNVGRNATYADQLFAVGNGEAAMAIQTPAALGTIYAVQAAGQFTDIEVGVSPIPGGGTGPNLPGGGALWLVRRGKDDARIAAAWDFARWLNEPAQQVAWHIGTGYVPIRRSATETPEVQRLWAERPTFRVAYDSLAREVDTDLAGPVIGPYHEVRDAITNALEAMFVGGRSPADALAEAQREADAALASYNERVGD